ncbi:MAG: ABC transporter ATP-binding protein [Alphaproteobacteria bacterium CG11_big_fil_rev_8_21_14_0_20_44_7]|nr:MAG: ABC transporter ATP-binding protein [Alphaproteobacteria bacterium CG11_big_fil_rev_8_21_14_0_20_44_7]
MAQSKDTLIQVKNLTNRFGTQTVHDAVNLDIKRGEILGIVGGSGSGKSVLLRTIIGLNNPQSGEILYRGKNILKTNPKEMAEIKAKWGVLFQYSALFSSLTVEQNIAAPLREHTKIDERMIKNLAALKNALVGLPPEALKKMPSELSGGMKKRAGLARALTLDPEILFLDEPTSGLDAISSAKFDKLIKDLKDGLGLTVVMVTHDLDSLFSICDRVAVVVDKKLIVDSLANIVNYDHKWIQEYFHNGRIRAPQSKGRI